MQIGLISLFAAMINALSTGGITARALDKHLMQLHYWNPRDFSLDKHRRVDDRPFGGGAGMLMQTQPLLDCINRAKQQLGQTTQVVYLSPQGQRLTQAKVKHFAKQQNLILISGRYEGIDERLLETAVDEECSIGDYVLSGGELASMVLIDAITRLLPDALGHADSAIEDSFYDGLLDYPHYTRPAGDDVPQVLLSGHHEKIRQWRLQQALGRTWLRRPDLLNQRVLETEEKQLLAEFIKLWWQYG